MSMLFFLCIILLSIATALLPLVIKYASSVLPDFRPHKASVWLPVAAGALMVISTQLPPIHLSNTTTFQQHFVGGGMYSACLYLYAKQVLGWRLYWAVDVIALFVWVSAFGVANKLIEFALLEFKLVNIYTGDAYWDLLANTLGGFLGYGLVLLVFRFSWRHGLSE